MSNKLKFKLRDDTPLRRHVATFWVVVPLDKATTPHQTNAEAEAAIRRLFPQYFGGRYPYELELWTAWDLSLERWESTSESRQDKSGCQVWMFERITTFHAKVVLRQLNSDGSQSIFLDISELDRDEDFDGVTTEPVFTIRKWNFHANPGKMATLELRIDPHLTSPSVVILNFVDPARTAFRDQCS